MREREMLRRIVDVNAEYLPEEPSDEEQDDWTDRWVALMDEASALLAEPEPDVPALVAEARSLAGFPSAQEHGYRDTLLGLADALEVSVRELDDERTASEAAMAVREDQLAAARAEVERYQRLHGLGR